jgi:hypothetical protein
LRFERNYPGEPCASSQIKISVLRRMVIETP